MYGEKKKKEFFACLFYCLCGFIFVCMYIYLPVFIIVCYACFISIV